jgi:hypothetical protein
MCGAPASRSRRTHFQRARLASGNRGQIDIIDIDGLAEDLVRTLPGYLTG